MVGFVLVGRHVNLGFSFSPGPSWNSFRAKVKADLFRCFFFSPET